MKKILLPFLIGLLLSSCATVLKKKSYELSISSNETNAKVKVYDSIYTLPSKVKVTRSNTDLDLVLITNSLNLEYTLKSSLNPTFLYWNFFGLQFAPLSYAIDLTNKKRFYYGDTVYLNTEDSLRVIDPPVRKFWTEYFSKTYSKHKKDINLTLSLPHVNGFYSKPTDYGTKVNTGFWGISTGLEYFYKDNKYFSLKFVSATDFFVPIPAAVTLDAVREHLSTTYVQFTDNFKFGRLHLGYGLNYSINYWRFVDETDPENQIEVKRKNHSLGLTTDIYYQFGKSFFMGLIYRPTFYRVRPESEFKYEHFISLDFAFKIPLRKR